MVVEDVLVLVVPFCPPRLGRGSCLNRVPSGMTTVRESGRVDVSSVEVGGLGWARDGRDGGVFLSSRYRETAPTLTF